MIRRDDIGPRQQFGHHCVGDLLRDIKPPAVTKNRVEDIGSAGGTAPAIDKGCDTSHLPGASQIAAGDDIDAGCVGKAQDTVKDRSKDIVLNRTTSAFSVSRMGGKHHRIDQQRMLPERGQHRSGDGVADKAGSDRRLDGKNLFHHCRVVTGNRERGKQNLL